VSGEGEIQGGAGAFSGSASVSLREADGILPFNNAYRSSGIGGSAAYDARRGGLRLTARRTTGRFEFPTDGAGVPVDSNQYTREIRDAVGLEGTLALHERASVRLTLAHAELDRTSANLPDSPGDSSEFYYVTDTRAIRRGADLRTSIAVTPAASLTIGAAYEWQRERADGTSTFGTFPLEPTHFDERRETRAAYAEVLGQAGPRVRAAIGGRLDDNSRFGVFRTGRASVTGWITASTAVRASVGTAFKEPLFSEVFPTAFSVGDSTLQPERTRSWEIGVEQTLGEDLRVGARWFDQRFRDLVQYRFVDRTQDLTTPNYANVAAATARGIELEAIAVPWSGGRLTASATRVRTEVTEEGFGASGTFAQGEPLLRRPDWLGSLSLAQDLTPTLHAGASVHYTGARSDYDFSAGARMELPAFTTVDAFADWTLPLAWSGGTIAATLRVENVFDEQYQYVLGFDSPGRVVLVGARVGVGKRE
jgi:vitamin B12 transporter